MVKNSIFLTLALVVSTGLWAQEQTTREQTMNVATYNLRFDNPADGANAWQHRSESVRALVGFHGFDVFGTQEGLRHQLEQLTADGEYSFVGVGRDDGESSGEHSAIVYRTERFKVLDTGTFWLSDTPDVPSLGWDAPSHRRICTWARFLDKETSERFWFFNAHYDHIGERARTESSKLILEKIAELASGDPAILVGDMNSTPDTEAIRILSGVMSDARTVSASQPYGPLQTFNDFSTDFTEPADRIDYIFCTPGMEVLRYGVLTDLSGTRPVRFPSDHFPVIVEVKL